MKWRAKEVFERGEVGARVGRDELKEEENREQIKRKRVREERRRKKKRKKKKEKREGKELTCFDCDGVSSFVSTNNKRHSIKISNDLKRD